ncbi:MAG TPA: hypothetical protein VMU33_17470 [Burkholderiaceae bacterium]|nr:hypothetical protein [Burkholderiaceae bacterium]
MKPTGTLLSAAIVIAAACMPPLSWADVTGTIVRTKSVQVADTSAVPGAQTFGDYWHAFPSPAPLRLRNTATREAIEITVQTADGRRVRVVQDRAPGLVVGAAVTVRKLEDREVVELR